MAHPYPNKFWVPPLLPRGCGTLILHAPQSSVLLTRCSVFILAIQFAYKIDGTIRISHPRYERIFSFLIHLNLFHVILLVLWPCVCYKEDGAWWFAIHRTPLWARTTIDIWGYNMTDFFLFLGSVLLMSSSQQLYLRVHFTPWQKHGTTAGCWCW